MAKVVKVSKEAMFDVVLAAFMHDYSLLGSPEERVIVRLFNGSTRVVYQRHADDSLDRIGLNELAGMIERFCCQLDGEYRITAYTASEMAKSLVNRMAINTEEIKIMRFKSEPGLCFNRLPFDPVDGPTPTWDLWCEHITNAAAVRMFMGSWFDESSDRSQFLVLYGTGGTGKSSYFIIPEKILGNRAIVSKTISPLDRDKHYFAELVSARVCYFDDFGDPSVYGAPIMRLMTGGGSVVIDQKLRDAYSTPLNCKYVFSTNEIPIFSQASENKRRVILSATANSAELSKIPRHEYEQRLMDEYPAFVYKCIEEYAFGCVETGTIPVDADSFELSSSIMDPGEDRFWIENFVLKADGFVSAHVLANVFERNGIKADVTKGKKYKHLSDKYQLNYKAHKIDGKVVKGIKGLCLRSSPLQSDADRAYETFMSGKPEAGEVNVIPIRNGFYPP
jgi:hypothetical protein